MGMRGAPTPATPVDDAGPLRPLLNGTIFAAIVYILDAWVIGQGGLAIFVGMIAAVVAVVRALNAGVRKDRPRAFAHLGVVVVWGTTIALTFVSVRFQANHAKSRAETVVDACKAYKAANGDYPAQLADLVPAYLPAVPRAKYTLTSAEFKYFHHPGRGETMLLFTEIPPFMHTSYNFEADRWSTLD
jgi:hypothetical protein